MNNILNLKSNSTLNFFQKWNYYFKIRFPVLLHGIVIFAFSFSAISYTLLCNGEKNFIPINKFLAGFAIAFTLFLLLRILDEFKDADDDKKFRPHLPVPSGIISLKELTLLGVMIVLFQLIVHTIFFPKMLVLYVIVMAYLFLMTKEFFIANWLRKNPFWYVTSHMMIIPLVDVYTSGLYWFESGTKAPMALVYFFAVSYFNGIVLEIGRKIKSPQDEALGVDTYTAMLGTGKAILLWIAILTITFVLSVVAARFASFNLFSILILGIMYLITIIPAALFYKNQKAIYAKYVEYASGLWTITMYFTLGGLPMLKSLFFH